MSEANKTADPAPVESIVMRFDPFDCEETAEVFRDDIARTLYLLWRRDHIVSDGFAADALMVGGNIRNRQPCTVDELIGCFRGLTRCQSYGTPINFTAADVKRFCENHLEYFTGGKSVGYRVELTA